MFEERVAEFEALARQQGLDFFPTAFEVVPQDIMTEVAAYGLPTRARHWSYGKVYQSRRTPDGYRVCPGPPHRPA